MKASKRERLRKAGFSIGSAADFLGLTAEELALIDMKLELARGVRVLRTEQSMSQAGLAKLLGSSQSRVAKIEAGDASVSIDLLMRALLCLGSTRRQIGSMVAKTSRPKRAA